MENLSQKEEIKAKAADYLDIVRSFSELAIAVSPQTDGNHPGRTQI